MVKIYEGYVISGNIEYQLREIPFITFFIIVFYMELSLN